MYLPHNSDLDTFIVTYQIQQDPWISQVNIQDRANSQPYSKILIFKPSKKTPYSLHPPHLNPYLFRFFLSHYLIAFLFRS